MVPMLQSASAPGRPYVLLASDELMHSKLIYNDAPLHIAGVRTPSAKLATYSKWTPATGEIGPETTELEFYDYNTPNGTQELTSTPNDPRARELQDLLLGQLIPDELRARLPGGLARAQAVARGETPPACRAGSGSRHEHFRKGPVAVPRLRTRILISSWLCQCFSDSIAHSVPSSGFQGTRERPKRKRGLSRDRSRTGSPTPQKP
jgi:hypothetical protein